jgi:acyl-CoA dehydrogenase
MTIQQTIPTPWASLAAAVAARAADTDASEAFPATAYEQARADGLLALGVPVELGGGGASPSDLCALMRTLGASCASAALALSMHTHQVAMAAWRWRHLNAPLEPLLRRVATEQIVLVSSGGSDWLESGGVARRVDGGYEVTARKAFSSGAPAGALLLTSAATEDGEVIHFGVPLNAPSVSVEPTWHAMGMRGTASHDIVLDRHFVADAAVSGKRAQGRWHMLYHVVAKIALPLIYSVYAGVADAARAEALALAARQPSADTVRAIGAMERQAALVDLLFREMQQMADTAPPGPGTTARSLTLRTLAAEAAIGTVTAAMEAAGGRAYRTGSRIERAFRDVQGARFHPARPAVQEAVAGRVALGLDIDG